MCGGAESSQVWTGLDWTGIGRSSCCCRVVTIHNSQFKSLVWWVYFGGNSQVTGHIRGGDTQRKRRDCTVHYTSLCTSIQYMDMYRNRKLVDRSAFELIVKCTVQYSTVFVEQWNTQNEKQQSSRGASPAAGADGQLGNANGRKRKRKRKGRQNTTQLRVRSGSDKRNECAHVRVPVPVLYSYVYRFI